MNLFVVILWVLLLATLHISTVQAGSEWAPLGAPICDRLQVTTNNDINDGDPRAYVPSNFGASIALTELNTNNQQQSFVLAVGSPTYTNQHLYQGRVQFYQFAPNQCVWKPSSFAAPITGERTEDRFGANVALSCNAQRVAVTGDIDGSGGGNSGRQGFVKVYERNGSNDWRQVGQTIINDQSLNAPFLGSNFGAFSMELSCDGNTLKVQSTSGVHIFDYISRNQQWETSRFLEGVLGSNQMSHDGQAIVMIEENEENNNQVSVYEREGSTWQLKGNTVALPQDSGTPRQVSISDNGSRVAVSTFNEEYVFRFNSDSSTWIQIGVRSEVDGSSDVQLSGNGLTLFGRDGNFLTAARRFDTQIDPNTQQTEWLRIGTRIGSNIDRFVVSDSGSVVITAADGEVQAFFYPDDTNAVSNGGLDCYPDYSKRDARSCIDDTEEEDDVEFIKGSIDVDSSNDAVSIIAIVVGGLSLLCLALVVLFLWLPKRNPGSTTSRNESTPTLEQIESEIKPLQSQDVTNSAATSDENRHQNHNLGTVQDGDTPEDSYMSTDV
jgi:hypothetical protein